MTDMLHLKAIEIIGRSLRASVKGEAKAREDMALGQYVAGMGFSNVGLGIAHSMAHTLSAFYDTPHGVACAMLLPTVMEYNADFTGTRFREIAKVLGVKGVDGMSEKEFRKAAIDAVRTLSRDVGIPQNLKGIVQEKDLDYLSESAMADACTPGNPRNPTKDEILKLFKSLL
jgi:Alcohol dehydrogenase, class IV